MPVSQPELYTEQIGENTWIAYCDGFEGIGMTEEQAIANLNIQINHFLKSKKKENGVYSTI